MNRRLFAVACTAAVSISLLSSCTTFTTKDTVATVNGTKISTSALEVALAKDNPTTTAPAGATPTPQADSPVSAEAARAALSALIVDQIQAGAPTFDDAATRALYEKGFSGPVICLAAIPTSDAKTADDAEAALASGTSFVDAAAKFSADATLASNGGVIIDTTTKSECTPSSVITNPTLAEPLRTAVVGVPTKPVDIGSGRYAILLLRPYADLSAATRTALSKTASLGTAAQHANVTVDPRYGRWDPATGTVVALV